MSRANIVLCFPAEPEQVDRISQLASNLGYQVLHSSQENIGQDILAAEIFCGHAKSHPIPWQDVVAAGKLKWIQSSAAGLDHCLDPAVVDSEILVSSCSGLFAHQVAEQAIALLFGLLRSMPEFARAQSRKEFIRRPTDQIQGKSVGIIGFGGNGQQIAKVLRPFDCRLLATDLFADEISFEGVEVFPADRLLKVAGDCEILIANLPLCTATTRLLGLEFFAATKPGCYFLNLGRGGTVDQSSLVKFLKSGHIRAAGLDVVDPEPLPVDSPLWEMENVILTPHVGAQSSYRLPETVELFCRNLERFSRKQPLINLVDKQLGFPIPKNRIKRPGLR